MILGKQYFNVIFDNNQINLYTPEGQQITGLEWIRVTSRVNDVNKCICSLVVNAHDSIEDMITYLSE